MNIFRLAGDMFHLMSIVLLLLKIVTIKSCAGTILASVTCSVPLHVEPLPFAPFSIHCCRHLRASVFFFLCVILVAGISLKTQELYLLVFVTRYLDLFDSFISVYNTLMKLIFLASSGAIVYYMRYDKIVRQKYDKEQDTFRHIFLIIPCFVLALLLNHGFTFTEVIFLSTRLSQHSMEFLCSTR